MGIQVTDLHMLRDQLVVRRQKLETAVARTETANLLQLLEQVDRALERVDHGSYGVCEVCKTSVEAERLFADPLTEICLDCLKPSEQRALEQDLNLAARIQAGLLPKRGFSAAGWNVAYHYEPAGQVSGDYFDYIKVDDERLGVAIADVSGKGIPASLIMAICRSVLRSQAIGNPSPADVLQKVNRQLYPDIKEDMFISMAYLVLDHARSAVTLARAGHDAPLLYRAKSKTVEQLKTPGMVVGIDSGDVFDRLTTDVAVELEAGDCILLYTDGITEALDNEGNEFGLERTTAAFRSSAKEGAQAMVNRLIDDLRNFVGSTPQNDDITLITIRKT